MMIDLIKDWGLCGYRWMQSHKDCSKATVRIMKCASALTAAASVSYSLNSRYQPSDAAASLKLLTAAMGCSIVWKTCCSFHADKQREWRFNGIFGGSVEILAELTLVSTVNLAFPYFLIHESGHWLSAKLLFKESFGNTIAPHRIQIRPFQYAKTVFTTSLGLTSVGKEIGKRRAFAVVYAGGIIASACCSFIETVLSKKIGGKYRFLSKLLALHGAAQSVQELVYAAGFLPNRNQHSSHDLFHLVRRFGISPLIPPIGICLAIPAAHLLASGLSRDY